MRTSINDLPVEILIDVMKYLDQRSLKAAILTCERWKQIIENHCFWSIRIDDRALSYLTVRHLQEINRKLNIKLLVHHKFAYEIDVYKQIGCAVIELIGNFLGHRTCLEYLKCFPNLEHMRVKYLAPPAMPDDSAVLDLKKLKSLKTIKCCHNIYKYFGTSNIKSLEIKKMSVDSQCVVNFIQRQKSLTKLILLFVNNGGTFFQQLCHATPNGTVPYKLAHLGIVCDIPPNIYIGIDKFMEMQSETLRKLRLDVEFSNSIIETLFGKLQNLKILVVHMPLEVEFGENVKENLSIENLTLRIFISSPLDMHQFCKRLPNVRNLSLFSSWDDELLPIGSTALNNVTTLCVNEFDEVFEAKKIPNLTSIFIENLLGGDIDWAAFCKTNSGITEMVIEHVYSRNFNLNHIEIITRNLKLQILKIGKGFSTDEGFLNIIRNNCPEIKVLELHKSCGITDLHLTDDRPSPLRLCDEIKFPNEMRFWSY